MEDISDVKQSLVEIKTTLKHVEESTKANATALAEISKPKDRTLTIIGMIVSLIFPIGFVIFAAGEYPKRANFEALESKMEARTESLRSDIDGLEKEGIRLRGVLDSLAKDVAVLQNRLETLSKPSPARRGAPSSTR